MCLPIFSSCGFHPLNSGSTNYSTDLLYREIDHFQLQICSKRDRLVLITLVQHCSVGVPMTAPDSIKQLVERFEANREAYRSSRVVAMAVRHTF